MSHKITTPKYEVDTLSLNKFVTSEAFINKVHMLLASSTSGKTVFMSAMVASLIYNCPSKKFCILNYSTTHDSLNKLELIKKFIKSKHKKTVIKLLHAIDSNQLEKTIQQIMHLNKNNRPMFDNFIVIMDDITHFLQTQKESSAIITNLVTCGRHYNITLIVCTHSYLHLNDALKQNINSLTFLGSKHSQDTLRKIYEKTPLISNVSQRPKDFLDAFNELKSKCSKYSALMLIDNNSKFNLFRVKKQWLDIITKNKKN